MAGINRLGKAPPKPGTLRPPDPNKYRTVDIFSEGAEGDADYMRMVHDIEEMQQPQVFDKGDLLYLRDEAERQRHAEMELRDIERCKFAALRAKMENKQRLNAIKKFEKRNQNNKDIFEHHSTRDILKKLNKDKVVHIIVKKKIEKDRSHLKLEKLKNSLKKRENKEKIILSNSKDIFNLKLQSDF